MMEHNRTSFTT